MRWACRRGAFGPCSRLLIFGTAAGLAVALRPTRGGSRLPSRPDVHHHGPLLRQPTPGRDGRRGALGGPVVPAQGKRAGPADCRLPGCRRLGLFPRATDRAGETSGSGHALAGRWFSAGRGAQLPCRDGSWAAIAGRPGSSRTPGRWSRWRRPWSWSPWSGTDSTPSSRPIGSIRRSRPGSISASSGWSMPWRQSSGSTSGSRS